MTGVIRSGKRLIDRCGVASPWWWVAALILAIAVPCGWWFGVRGNPRVAAAWAIGREVSVWELRSRLLELKSLSTQERFELAGTQERLRLLPPQERQRIERLFEAIRKEPDRERLMDAAASFHARVYSKMTSAEQSKFKGGSRKDQLQLALQERGERLTRLSRRDAELLRQWCDCHLEMLRGRLKKLVKRWQDLGFKDSIATNAVGRILLKGRRRPKEPGMPERDVAGKLEGVDTLYRVLRAVGPEEAWLDMFKSLNPKQREGLADLCNEIAPNAEQLEELLELVDFSEERKEELRQATALGLGRGREQLADWLGVVLNPSKREPSHADLAKTFAEIADPAEKERLLYLPAEAFQAALRELFLENYLTGGNDGGAVPLRERAGAASSGVKTGS